jgi:hypothetical protein
MKDIIAFLFVLTLFLGMAPTAHAQGTEGVEIKPGIVEDRVNPGETFRFTLSVKNLAPETKTYFLLTEDIVGVSDEGLPVFAPEGQATGYEISKWIETPYPSITLQAGETGSVPFTVKVPLEATPGSHFGGLFFLTTPPKAGASGAAIGIQVGSVISLRISGDIIENARLREFSSGKMVYNTPNVDFNVRVENLSNVLLRPRGTIDITDMRGKQVAVVRVNDSQGAVFPETERLYRPVWEYDSFAFGRYQAVLSLVYGEDSRKTISGVTTFWVLPLKLILTVLGSLLGIVLVLYFVVRSYIAKKLRDMGVPAGKEYYGKRYNRSASRMMAIVATMFLCAIVLLAVLFFMFA